jgi:hypothetical protein
MIKFEDKEERSGSYSTTPFLERSGSRPLDLISLMIGQRLQTLIMIWHMAESPLPMLNLLNNLNKVRAPGFEHFEKRREENIP